MTKVPRMETKQPFPEQSEQGSEGQCRAGEGFIRADDESGQQSQLRTDGSLTHFRNNELKYSFNCLHLASLYILSLKVAPPSRSRKVHQNIVFTSSGEVTTLPGISSVSSSLEPCH